jgi:hypothetical protein
VGVVLGYSGEMTLKDLLVEALHILCGEGRLECNHLVENAPERPNVRLDIVRLVAPDLGARIVGSASLGVVQSALVGNFRDIHVAELGSEVSIQEDVRALEIAMHYVEVMHCLEPAHHLNEYLPYLLLSEGTLVLLVVRDLLEEVAIVRVLHDNATQMRQSDGSLPERLRRGLDKCLFVLNDVGIAERRKDSDLIDRVIFLLV